MKALIFVVKYGWIPFVPACLVAFLPLALSADVVGGIPNWWYWHVSLYGTMGLVLMMLVSGVYLWMRSRSNHHHGHRPGGAAH